MKQKNRDKQYKKFLLLKKFEEDEDEDEEELIVEGGLEVKRQKKPAPESKILREAKEHLMNKYRKIRDQ